MGYGYGFGRVMVWVRVKIEDSKYNQIPTGLV